MTIPFIGLFQKAKARFFPTPEAPVALRPRPLPSEKRIGERLSKTVMPNATRTVAPADPLEMAASPLAGMKTLSRDLPPAVAFALEPKVERAISLQLSDILPSVPSGYVKPTESLDVNRTILLKASELEKGMASGRPTVLLASIYEQAPEIFLHSLTPDDPAEVSLPHAKVLEQFGKLQVRADQMSEESVPQVETPILQVTVEDTQRFGTVMKPLQGSALPPVIVEPATAQTIAKAEPEPVARGPVAPTVPAPRGIPLTPSKEESAVAPPSQPATPTRIPFNLPPNGAGVPASERVPASSGPPVPTSPPPSQPTPARIPFKISAPCADLRPKLTLVPGVEATETPVAASPPIAQTQGEVKISLSLQAVLQNLPAFQLSGSPSTVPEDVRIELPFSMIESQLATGRVAVEPKIFRAAIPENYRELFSLETADAAVLLPLQEVLKNLPSTALKMRQDQEEVESVNLFETPFSRKAEEDAKIFQVSSAPIAKLSEAPAASGENISEAPAEKIEPLSLQESHEPVEPTTSRDAEEDGKISAKEVVADASALPGVAGCSVIFADGLSLAGNLPADIAADGLCAMAPSLLQRIDKHMLETNLGALNAMTLHCARAPVSFFMQGNICLTVLHAGEKLESETQQKLSEMTKKLSRVYAQPEAAHVDH